jgi:CheY-like chemotaxis protein
MMLDDEKFLLEMYKLSFEKRGYETAIFTDADAALTALRGGYTPDAILFDIQMPDSMSGYQFIETVKQEGLAPKSVKVALTNVGQDGAVERMKELGADVHLYKVGYTPSEIVAKVGELLGVKEKPAESGAQDLIQ